MSQLSLKSQTATIWIYLYIGIKMFKIILVVIFFTQLVHSQMKGNKINFKKLRQNYKFALRQNTVGLKLKKIVQWAKTWKKIQFQMCIWVVARLPQRLKSTFFEMFCSLRAGVSPSGEPSTQKFFKKHWF